jgi:excisionase family DNA binding protein
MSEVSTDHGRHEKRVQTTAQRLAAITPLVVSPREAARMLSLGVWRVYKLMKAGELASYEHGRSRRITVASIHEYIARRVATASANGWQQWPFNPARRRQERQASRERA